jgi:hypothetical protein
MTNQGYGVRVLDNAKRTHVKRVVISECNQGVSATNTILLRVRASQIRLNPGNSSIHSVGITATMPSLSAVGGIGIYDCVIAGFVQGVSLDTVSDALITRCVIGDKIVGVSPSQIGGIFFNNCTNSIISYCTLHNIAFGSVGAVLISWGIYLRSSDTTLVYGCQFNGIRNQGGSGNIAYGVFLFNADMISISDCAFISLGTIGQGISVTGACSNCVIRDNKAYSLDGTGGYWYYWDATGSNNIFTRNLAMDYTPNTGFAAAIANVSTNTADNNIMYNHQFA